MDAVRNEPSRRARKKERTRLAIERSGLELFARQGFKETTVAEIAEAADVAASTFFLHFPTKEDLVFAGHDAEALHLVDELRSGEGTTLERLRGYLWTLSDPAEWDGDLWARRIEVIRRTPALQEEERVRWGDVVRPALVDTYAADLGEQEPYVEASLLAAMTVAGLVELGRIELESADERYRSSEWKREGTALLLERLEALYRLAATR
jgi:AcrR family transcriptional regulator